MSKQQLYQNALDNNPVEIPGDVFGIPNTKAIIPSRKALSPVQMDNGQLSLHGFQFTRRGLIAPANATQEQWLDVGEFLFNLEEGIQLLIGDYLVGVEHEYGITYQKLAEATGKSEKTLRNYKTVAGSINLSLRRDNLFFGHYSLLQAMKPKDQKYWIDRASQESWSIAQLRNEIKKTIGKEADRILEKYKTRIQAIKSVSQDDWNQFNLDQRQAIIRAYQDALADLLKWNESL